MNRLSLELRRLYQPRPDASASDAADDDPKALIDVGAPGQVGGRTRALVLGLTQPADWAVLSRLWHGVQTELGLPAPAIAVDGRASLQLWFSLAEPLSADVGVAWLEALSRRYLPDTAPARVTTWPQADPTQASGWRHAEPVPALQADGPHWSAFVAPDLAAVFADDPWIDLPPNLDGQAQLLSRLGSIQPDGVASLLTAAQPPAETPAGRADVAVAPPVPGPRGPTQATNDPRQFLLSVMNDDSVPMALRIDAARALLGAGHEPAPHG